MQTNGVIRAILSRLSLLSPLLFSKERTLLFVLSLFSRLSLFHSISAYLMWTLSFSFSSHCFILSLPLAYFPSASTFLLPHAFFLNPKHLALICICHSFGVLATKWQNMPITRYKFCSRLITHTLNEILYTQQFNQQI